MGVVQIPAEHAGSGHCNNADFIAGTVALIATVCIDLDDANAAVRYWVANRAKPDRSVQVCKGMHTGGLGHAVNLDNKDVQFFLQCLADRNRNCRAAASHIAQAGNIGVTDRHRERSRENCRHAGEDFRTIARNQRPNISQCGRISPTGRRQNHQTASARERCQGLR